MRILIIIFLLIPTITNAQNKYYTFFSDYQFDKTYNGSKKESRHFATISFSDPKSITVPGSDLQHSPRGYMIFKFDGLPASKEEVTFLERSKQGYDIYAITNTETGNDIIYVIKDNHTINKKLYNYTILLGKVDENNIGAIPKYFTAFHCNMINNNSSIITGKTIAVNKKIKPKEDIALKGLQYIVVAEKAYFYDITNTGGSRRKAYLVEGEKIIGLKEIEGYIYCEFTNSITKKISKGWILKTCLDTANPNILTPKSIDKSPFSTLLKLDGEYTQNVNFFNKPIIILELKKLLINDFQKFASDFLRFSAGVPIEVRNKVLFVDTFVPHAGPNNRALLFIDIINHESFLYWNDSNGNIKFYGKNPISKNMAYFIQQQLKNNMQYKDNPDRLILENLLSKYSSE